MLLFDLKNDKKVHKFEVGSILIFSNGELNDYHMVIQGSHYTDKHPYKLLSLEDFTIIQEATTLESLSKHVHNTMNGFALVEVLNPDEVILRRVVDE